MKRENLQNITPLMELSKNWRTGEWSATDSFYLANHHGHAVLKCSRPDKLFAVIRRVEDLSEIVDVDEPTVGIAWPSGAVALFRPDNWSEYEGRQFAFRDSDCFTLVRDYYLREYGYELPVADAALESLQNNSMPSDRFWSHPAVQRFEAVLAPKNGDVVYMAFNNTAVPNHCGIWLDEGLLHHFNGRLSCVEPYEGMWQRTTVAFMRRRIDG